MNSAFVFGSICFYILLHLLYESKVQPPVMLIYQLKLKYNFINVSLSTLFETHGTLIG